MARNSSPAPRRSPERVGRPPQKQPETSSPLQLSIAKEGIGLELSSPVQVGCINVRELAASLPDLKFPVDVSGGVARFRNRRGRLERIVVELARTDLEAWAAPKLRGVIGPTTPRVSTLVRRSGATVGLVDDDRAAALAFDVELESSGADVALTIHDARGIGLPGPATALAIRALAAMLPARREGARFVAPSVASDLARRLFPDSGARSPDGSAMVISVARGHEDGWLFVADRAGRRSEPSAPAVVAREAAALAAPSDDAAFDLDLERARELALAALTRAPRHRELLRRLAEIDAHVGGRAEAALATLREGDRAGRPASELLAGDLARETGDRAGAIASFAQAGESEPIGLVAALAYQAAAALATDLAAALGWLDRAVARAPQLRSTRWARLTARVAALRLDDARADAEHLEALSSASRDKHAVWVRAGGAFADAGLLSESALLYERALRYEPSDPEALRGLGAALVAVGKVPRGAELLAQSIELAEAAGTPSWRAHVDLARTLAEALGDLPAAVAHVQRIPAHALEVILARGLEGRWRAQLGDLAGAELAYARARERIEATLGELPEADRQVAFSLLHEAAQLAQRTKKDWKSAERILALALKVCPGDDATRRAYETAARRAAGLPAEEEAPASTKWDLERTLDAPTQHPPPTEAELHARVEELTRKVQGDPNDDVAVDQLADALLGLGRAHELFALLSARLEEATPERRAALIPKQRKVLRQLEETAQAEGHADEAALYRDAAAALEAETTVPRGPASGR